MTTLYSPETIRREKHRARCGFLAALILGLSALILCIALCFGIRTANAASRRNAVILISTLSGWCVILLVRGLILPECPLQSPVSTRWNQSSRKDDPPVYYGI